MWIDFLVGMLSEFAVKILTSLRIQRIARTPLTRFWDPMFVGGLRIITPYEEKEAEIKSQVLDFQGLAILREALEKHYRGRCVQTDCTNVSPEDLRRNLLLVAGPIPNEVTRHFLNPTNEKVRYYFRGNDIVDGYNPDFALHVELQRRGMYPVVDYGIISRLVNPFDRTKFVIISSGMYGWGTYAGLVALAKEDNLRFLLENARTGEFQILVKVGVFRRVPEEPILLKETLHIGGSEDLCSDKPSKTILVFAPHPDDETLACGGTIRKRIAQGCDVKIVFMTDGSHSHSAVLGIYSEPSPDELVEIRQKEALAAAAILGVEAKNLIFMGAEDGALATVEEAMVERVKQVLLDEHNVVEAYLPHAKDQHQDHRATSAIVSRALEELGLWPEVYSFIVWGEEAEEETKKNLGTMVEIDISDVLSVKVEAMKQYESQIGLISPEQDRPVLEASLVERFCARTTEVFWKQPLGSPVPGQADC